MNLKKFAPFALYLAGIALVAAISTFIIFQSFHLAVQISLGVMVLCLALAVIFNPQRAKEVLTGKQARYTSNALILTIAVIGLLVVVNILANKYSKSLDLTENQDNTLTQETIDLLNKMPSPITAQAFFTSATSSDTAKSLLESYKRNSNGKFNYEFINPEENPLAAQNANITRDGTIVVIMDNRQEQVTYVTEQELSSALFKLLNPELRVAYFISGHGEYDIESLGDESYNMVKQVLESKNYTVNMLNLITASEIPSDAAVLVLGGPQKTLTQNEVDLLKTYLDNGGSLIILKESAVVAGTNGQSDPFVEYLKTSWGIQLNNDLIVFPNENYHPLVVFSNVLDDNNAITSKLVGNVIVMPTAQSITISTIENITTYVLASSAPEAWGETNFNSIESSTMNYSALEDLPGPLTLAVSAIDNTTNARIVVVGDSEFPINGNFSQYANGDFLINSIDWAARQDDLISLTPKQNVDRLLLTPTGTTMGLILLVVILIIPGGIVLAGVVTWIRRRRQG